MWWNPSLTLNSSFLEMIPVLDRIALQRYPISPRNLKNLTNLAVDEGNVLAVIGGLKMLFFKNRMEELKGNFEVVSLASLDKLFYSMSQPKMGKQVQYLLHWLARMIFKKCFQSCQKSNLQHFLSTLNQLISLTQKILKSSDRDRVVQQTHKIILEGFNTFQTFLQDSKTSKDREYFKARFKESTEVLIKNKKQAYFFNILYEIKYLVIDELNKLERLMCPSHLISFISGQLFLLLNTIRLSFSIEHLSFIMKKILFIRESIPNEKYMELMRLIQSIIDTLQFNQINLQNKVSFFSYHIICNHYFTYLQRLFDDENNSSARAKLISWKEQLRKAIQREVQQTKELNLEEVITYVKIRNRESCLYGFDLLEVNHFPDISSKLFKSKVMVHPIFLGITSVAQLPQLLYLNQYDKPEMMMKNYKQFNIVEKGIYLYYLCFIKAIRNAGSLQQINIQEYATALHKFYRQMNNRQLFQITEFFLFQIELGNYYTVSDPQDKVYSSQVNDVLYNDLLEVFSERVIHCLDNFKIVQTVDDLNDFVLLNRYFVILENPILICFNCKKIQKLYTCPHCQEITHGVQLKNKRHAKITEKDQSFSRVLLTNIKSRAREIVRQVILSRKDNPEVEWLFMCQCVLVEIIHLLR